MTVIAGIKKKARVKMDREEVVSSNIESIGYDDGEQTLEVEFRGGSVYQYFDVPAEVYQGLMDAGSSGSFLAREIKGVFRCERVE
jgi:hypothetical protein